MQHTVLQRRAVCVTVYFSVLQCIAVYCSVLQCIAVCCSVLQCVAVYFSVLQCISVCCSECRSALLWYGSVQKSEPYKNVGFFKRN